MVPFDGSPDPDFLRGIDEHDLVAHTVKNRTGKDDGRFQDDERNGSITPSLGTVPALPSLEIVQDGRMDDRFHQGLGNRIREDDAGQTAAVQPSLRIPEGDLQDLFHFQDQGGIPVIEGLGPRVRIIDGDPAG